MSKRTYSHSNSRARPSEAVYREYALNSLEIEDFINKTCQPYRYDPRPCPNGKVCAGEHVDGRFDWILKFRMSLWDPPAHAKKPLLYRKCKLLSILENLVSTNAGMIRYCVVILLHCYSYFNVCRWS
jgi:hypothetical protein